MWRDEEKQSLEAAEASLIMRKREIQESRRKLKVAEEQIDKQLRDVRERISEVGV